MDKDFFIIDSEEEALIKNCMKNSYHIPGIIGLIGLSNGGIAKSVIFSTVKLRQYNKIFVCIDPYGSMPHYKEENLLVNNIIESVGIRVLKNSNSNNLSFTQLFPERITNE